MIESLRLLFRNRQFCLICLCYGLGLGIYAGWAGILAPILKPLNYTQDEAAYIGLSMTVLGTLAGLVAGRLADQWKRFKGLLVFIFAVSSVGFFLFLLVALTWVDCGSYSYAVLFVLGTIGGTALNASTGLFYEGAVEATYPISEDVSGTVLAMTTNLVGLVFLLAANSMAPAVVNGLLAFSLPVLTVAIWAGYTDTRRRAAVDISPSPLLRRGPKSDE